MKENKVKELMEIIDLDWIEENPGSAYELMEWMYRELQHRKDVIEMDREALLLANVLLQKYKDDEEQRKNGWDGEVMSDWT